MEWNQLFAQSFMPSLEDIARYIGGDAAALFCEWMAYMDAAYRAKPKLTYSSCAMKPGWNIKFQKSGQSLGTLYPEEGAFSVFLVISYKFSENMDQITDSLSLEARKLWREAEDYMKLGRWMMLRVERKADLEDLKRFLSVKLAPRP